MVMIRTMIVVNIYEAKAKLSEYLEAVSKGERVVICNRNRPVAELRAAAATRTTPRLVGGAKGVELLSSFFDPLPDDLLDAFDPVIEARTGTMRVAEAKAPYAAPARRGKHK